MKRIIALIAIFALCLPQFVAAYPYQDRYNYEVITVTGEQADPALVAAYWFQTPTGLSINQTSRYMPRQWQNGLIIFDSSWGNYSVTAAGIGVGCDVFNSNNSGSQRTKNNNDYHKIRLNRDATVHVIWREAVSTKPTWIDDSYTAGATVQAKRLSSGATATWTSYNKAVPAGDALFGASWSADVTPTGARNLPWFVICEADGQPSSAPVVSQGIGPEEIPVANQACPAWVHDLHMTTIEGVEYRTWHPQIDPVYWCYYHHEHGSDPAYYDESWVPAFGEVGIVHGMSENHWGYKFYVWDKGDYRVGLMVHMGTTGLGRVCQQFHEVQFRVKQISTGTEMAYVKWIGNFGAAVENETGVRLTPDACPTQGTVHVGNGTRRMPVVNGGSNPVGPTIYEPWRIGCTYLVNGAGCTLLVNAPEIVTACLDIACNTGVDLGFSGTLRFVTVNDFGVTYRPEFGVDGRYCTDPLGEVLLPCTDPMAIDQYIAPGFSNTFGQNQHISDVLGWGLPFQFNSATGFNSEREDSIPIGANN